MEEDRKEIKFVSEEERNREYQANKEFRQALKVQSERKNEIERQYGFKKGQIGNPRGRSKRRQDLANLCKTWTFEKGGFEKVVALTECGDPKTELKACELIMGYAVGKPSTVLEADENLNQARINLAVFTNKDLYDMLNKVKLVKEENKPEAIDVQVVSEQIENKGTDNGEEEKK